MLKNNVEEINENKLNSEHLKVIICGGVDSGKSSLIGVLVNNVLDDGNGYARKTIMKNKHEIETGRTSQISYNYIKYKNREVTVLDSAGHLKYLKTTLHGINGHFVDYALVVYGANMKINPMFKEHSQVLMMLGIPIIVVITKIDIPDKEILKNHKRLIFNFPKFNRKCIDINSEEDYTNLINNIKVNGLDNMIPVLSTSSKLNINIDKIHKLLELLPIRRHRHDNINIPKSISDIKFLAYIECVYQVKGIGIVITGTLPYNTIPVKINDILFIGPVGNNEKKFYKIRVRSIHNNFRENVTEVIPGNNFCLNIKFVKESCDINFIKKKGVIISNKSLTDFCSSSFKAHVTILNKKNIDIRYKTTIRRGYTPVVHCRTIRQAAKIINIKHETIENVEILEENKEYELIFKFVSKPEFIEVGAPIFFRDGITKGRGVITEIL